MTTSKKGFQIQRKDNRSIDSLSTDGRHIFWGAVLVLFYHFSPYVPQYITTV